MKKLALVSLVAAFALVGCSATRPVQTGGLIQKNTGKKVTASVSHANIMGFTPISLTKTDEVLSKLQTQCGGSKVTNVTTLQKSRWVIFAVLHELQASGYCAE
jgi:uncharacterized protein YcfL